MPLSGPSDLPTDPAHCARRRSRDDLKMPLAKSDNCSPRAPLELCLESEQSSEFLGLNARPEPRPPGKADLNLLSPTFQDEHPSERAKPCLVLSDERGPRIIERPLMAAWATDGLRYGTQRIASGLRLFGILVFRPRTV